MLFFVLFLFLLWGFRVEREGKERGCTLIERKKERKG